MGRDAVAITLAKNNAAVNTPAGVAISETNGASIANASKHRKVLVRVTNTITNATKVVTFKAGVYPPAFRQGLGDLAITVPQSGDILIQLESARFLQADGTINVDYGAGMTGALSALQMPAAAS